MARSGNPFFFPRLSPHFQFSFLPITFDLKTLGLPQVLALFLIVFRRDLFDLGINFFLWKFSSFLSRLGPGSLGLPDFRRFRGLFGQPGRSASGLSCNRFECAAFQLTFNGFFQPN